MRSGTIIRDSVYYARETFTIFALAVLFLVTGCSDSRDYTPRVELAPAPPFMTHPQEYGPPLPYELAVLREIEGIRPSGGEEPFGPVAGCSVRTGFSETDSNIAFGFGGLPRHDSELSFSELNSHYDAPGMTIRLSVSLPSPVKTRSCH
jgi:hypothetical protein